MTMCDFCEAYTVSAELITTDEPSIDRLVKIMITLSWRSGWWRNVQ